MYASALFYEDTSTKLDPMIPEFLLSGGLSCAVEELMPMLLDNNQTICKGIPVKRCRGVQRLPQCWVTPVLLTGFVLLLGGKPHLENYWCPAVHYGLHWELAYGLVNCD